MAEHMMSNAITRAVTEATGVVLQMMAEAQAQRTQNPAGPKLGGPTLKQHTFDWEAPDKYTELKTFKLKVSNVLSTYGTPEAEKLEVVKNWLGRKGLHILETIMLAEKEVCNMLDGLFDMLATKFNPQYNETIKSLQFRKLFQFDNENVEEWMGRLHVVAVECSYRELDRQLKEQFIHGLNDRCMLEEIIKEVTATNNDDQITSEGMLAWAKRVEAQRAQVAILSTITELRQFDN